ncbi:MAG: SUMF1/EgtB/PvdO family nonheme iron enzyme [Phycisphaerae bacterium]|jgi:formylglycine-generating enzyme required for sulfatase activity
MTALAALVILAAPLFITPDSTNRQTTSAEATVRIGPPTSRDCIWDNIPSGILSTAVHASQRDEVYPFRAGAADDFICGACSPAGQECAIVSVQWWGQFFNPGPPGNATAFEINFYADDGDQPTGAGLDNPRPTAAIAIDVPIEDISTVLVGSNIYQFDYMFPPGSEPILQSQTRYWLEIVSVNVTNPQWGRSSTASDQTLAVATQGFPALNMPYWTPIEGRDLAFRVYSTSGGSEPLPLRLLPVGNPGNLPDLRTDAAGVGAVPYTYQIGETEITAGQYCEFLNAVAADDTYGLYNPEMWDNAMGCKIERLGAPGAYTYQVSAAWVNRPVNYVSWGDAVRFANWLTNGKPHGPQDLTTTEDGSYFVNGAVEVIELQTVTRAPQAIFVLPSADEWYKAAYHYNDGPTDHYYDYPTGHDNLPSNDIVSPDPGNNANFFQDGFTLGSPSWRTRVGEFENSFSPYRTFDQAGNVWEWTEEPYNWSDRTCRGGSYGSYDSHLRPDSPLRLWNIVEDEEIGFRIANVAPPPGDVNGDGTVNLDDLDLFVTCLAGPDNLPGCETPWADIDWDGDADLADFATFQTAFTGD